MSDLPFACSNTICYLIKVSDNLKKLDVKVRMEEKRLNETIQFKVKILTLTQFKVDLAGN